MTFHPHEVNSDINVPNLCCVVEGREEPLTLTVSGSCIEKTPFKEVSLSAGCLLVCISDVVACL